MLHSLICRMLPPVDPAEPEKPPILKPARRRLAQVQFLILVVRVILM
jgi:hypothetical protein